MDHEGIVVVISLAVASEVSASGLQYDDVAAVDQTGGDRGALDEDTIQRAEDLVDDGLLPGELAAPGALADGAPDDVLMARLLEGGAIALSDLLEDGRDKLGVG